MNPIDIERIIREFFGWGLLKITNFLAGFVIGSFLVFWWHLQSTGRKRIKQLREIIDQLNEDNNYYKDKVEKYKLDLVTRASRETVLQERIALLEKQLAETGRGEKPPLLPPLPSLPPPPPPEGRLLGGIRTERWSTYSKETLEQREAIKTLIEEPAARRGFRYVRGNGSDSLIADKTVLKVLPPVPRIAEALPHTFSLFLGIRTPHKCWEGLAATSANPLVNVQGVEFEVFGIDPNDSGTSSLINHIIEMI
jgi:hypothetical protein